MQFLGCFCVCASKHPKLLECLKTPYKLFERECRVPQNTLHLYLYPYLAHTSINIRVTVFSSVTSNNFSDLKFQYIFSWDKTTNKTRKYFPYQIQYASLCHYDRKLYACIRTVIRNFLLFSRSGTRQIAVSENDTFLRNVNYDFYTRFLQICVFAYFSKDPIL